MALALTVYIVAHTVSGEMQDPNGFERAVERLRTAQIQRVVLESYRGGLSVDEAIMVKARDQFKTAGFETMGGLMPVWGEGFGKRGEGVETHLPFFCYSSEETVSAIEGEIRKLARLFDDVVIDDALMTSCRCDTCDRARGDKEWPEFRQELLCGATRRWVRAAHEENPNAKLIVKFPQTYDRYHVYGYDTAHFPEIFDGVWVGSESRDPETVAFGYTEQYQGYFNIRWMRACAGPKFEAAWYDYLDCNDTLFYLQAVTTALGRPDRTVMFCYGDNLFSDNRVQRVTEGLPGLERLWQAAEHPRGVFVLKPPNSDGSGDLFIYDDFGMLGIPCVPTTQLSPDMRSVIVPAQGFADRKTGGAIKEIIRSGGQVIVTHAALQRITDQPDLLALFGYRPQGVHPVRTRISGIELDGKVNKLEQPFHVPGDLAPEKEATIAARAKYGEFMGSRYVPLVTVMTHPSGGKAIVWNIGAFGHDAYNIEESLCVPVRSEIPQLPAPVVNLLRNMAIEPLGFSLSAPARVACFLFEKKAVFVNYRAEPADIVTNGLGLDLSSLYAAAEGTAADSERSIRLAPHSFAMVGMN